MSLALIEDLAYQLKKGKENGKRAIVFLGAGASKTGGIPLAGELITEILDRYSIVPNVKRLSSEEKKSYTKVMAALDPADRKALFKHYIDKAKINASHIYLAHMMKEGYIDFVFTVNFDNLMQRALGLFNMYPAVYDMAMLKGMTTAPFESPGLVYLHGQHHGFNLLNTENEFNSVSKLLNRCFIPVANRPWIVVGYSGEDPVLNYINELGRFEHGLYWVCYNGNEPSERVNNCLFSHNNEKHSFKLKGYDADSFFVKLHNELELPQPPIVDTPFSYIKGLQENIIDIEDEELKIVKDRLDITKNWINEAITTYEQPGTSTMPNKEKIELEKIKKNLIDIIVTEKYEMLPEFSEKYNYPSLKKNLSSGYTDWGTTIYKIGQEAYSNDAIKYYLEAIEKYKTAASLYPENATTHNNWGITLNSIGKTLKGEKAISYYKQAINEYKKATSIQSDYAFSYYNWAISLFNLGEVSIEEEAILYFKRAIEKYKLAVRLKPDYTEAYNNWGIALNYIGRASKDKDVKNYFKQAIEKFEKAANLNPEYANVYYNWGLSLNDLGIKSIKASAINYHKQAIEKFKKTISLLPDYAAAYYSWGFSLSNLGIISTSELAVTYYKDAISKYNETISIEPDYGLAFDACSSTLLRLRYLSVENEKTTILLNALELSKKGHELTGNSYNLSCCYALLNDTIKAFKYLEEALQKDKILFTHVSEDRDWDQLRNHPEYTRLKEQYG